MAHWEQRKTISTKEICGHSEKEHTGNKGNTTEQDGKDKHNEKDGTDEQDKQKEKETLYDKEETEHNEEHLLRGVSQLLIGTFLSIRTHTYTYMYITSGCD